MKTKNRILLLFLFFCFLAQAQESREDVVYLKNGTVYRGMIVEEVFNVSLTIEDAKGVEHKVEISEVAKITKEFKSDPLKKESNISLSDTVETHATVFPDLPRGNPMSRGRRERPPFIYPIRTAMFQTELGVGLVDFGARFTAGYRFGQFGILGAGLGFYGFDQGLSRNYSGDEQFKGWYFPLYLYYSGDILPKRVTPFYSLEAGYSFRYTANDDYLSVSLDHPKYQNKGGATGSVSFGVRLYSRHKVSASWALNLDIQQMQNKYTNYSNAGGQNVYVSYSSMTAMFIPGIKIAIGF